MCGGYVPTPLEVEQSKIRELEAEITAMRAEIAAAHTDVRATQARADATEDALEAQLAIRLDPAVLRAEQLEAIARLAMRWFDNRLAGNALNSMYEDIAIARLLHYIFDAIDCERGI